MQVARVRIGAEAAKGPPEGCVSIGRQSAVFRRTVRNILEDVMRKTITALVATASVAAAGLAAPKPAEARCLGCWIGAGIAAAVIGGAFASRAYGYGYGYGYPAYSYGYGYPAYSYGYGYPAYSYGYGYPAYGYAGYGYAPAYYAPRRYYARRYYRY
jgi:hypothetical protein